MSKKNLCFVGLTKNFTDIICKQLSAQLEMYYANIGEIIEFELFNTENVEEICGIEYLLKQEIKIIKKVSTYENTIINIEYSKLNNETNLNSIKDNCLLIYLRLDGESFDKELLNDKLSNNQIKIQQDLLQDRDFICKNISDLYINCNNLNLDELIELIINNIMKYYSK